MGKYINLGNLKKYDGLIKKYIRENSTKITIDSVLSSSSTNPVQNKVINSALANCVSLNTAQEISGFKTFNGYITSQKVLSTTTYNFDLTPFGGIDSYNQDVALDPLQFTATLFNVDAGIDIPSDIELSEDGGSFTCYGGQALNIRTNNRLESIRVTVVGTSGDVIGGDCVLESTDASSDTSTYVNFSNGSILFLSTAVVVGIEATESTVSKTLYGNEDIVVGSKRIYFPSKAGTFALTSDIPSVPSWALASSKPSYSWDEITEKPTVPTKTSELTNDSGFLTSHLTVDSSLSSSSTNPVQNKVVNAALSNKLGKTTYEWNKEIAFGSTGKLCIGKFSCYDSNITIEINSTTSTTYHAVLIIATQNIATASSGSLTATVYGDASNTVAPNIFIFKPSTTDGSNDTVEVYFSPQPYSKNLIHIQAQALADRASDGSLYSDICTSVTSIPSSITGKTLIQPTNALTSKFLTSFTETDPTVPAWAKASTKPSYSWSEIGSKPTFATVSTSGSYNDLSDKPTIPTKTSELTNDSKYVKSDYANMSIQWGGSVTSTSWLCAFVNQSLIQAIAPSNLSVGAATKATQDASGNVITSTYATKTELTNAIKGVLGEGVGEAYDTFVEIQKLLEADDKQTADLISKVNTNTSNIATLNTSLSNYMPLSGGKFTAPISFQDSSLPQSSGMQYICGITAFASGGQLQWANASAVSVGSATKATNDSDGNAINTTYAKISSLSAVATSGSYNDLSDKPTIPTKTSQLTNDSGFLTGVADSNLRVTLRSVNASATAGADSATVQGWHYIGASDTKRPPFKQVDGLSGNDYRIMTTAYGSTWLQQIATDFRSNDIFTRRNQNGTWQGWTALVKMQQGLASPIGTDNALVRWDATRNATVQDSNAILDDSGNLTLAGTLTTSGKISVAGASMDANGYVIGTWLKTTANIHLSSSTYDIPVLSSGWIYSRTKEEFIADLGLSSGDYAPKTSGLYYVDGSSSTTAGTWLGTSSDITALYDGLAIKYKVAVAGGNSTTGTTLNINSLGAKNVYLRGTSKVTTHYAVGTMLTLVYNSTTDAWYTSDYDANSYAYQRLYGNVTANSEYPVTFSYSTAIPSSYSTYYGAVKSGFTFNPSTGALSATSFKENGTALSSKYGSLSGTNTWSGTNTFSSLKALSGSYGFHLDALGLHSTPINVTTFTDGSPNSMIGTKYDHGQIVYDPESLGDTYTLTIPKKSGTIAVEPERNVITITADTTININEWTKGKRYSLYSTVVSSPLPVVTFKSGTLTYVATLTLTPYQYVDIDYKTNTGLTTLEFYGAQATTSGGNGADVQLVVNNQSYSLPDIGCVLVWNFGVYAYNKGVQPTKLYLHKISLSISVSTYTAYYVFFNHYSYSSTPYTDATSLLDELFNSTDSETLAVTGYYNSMNSSTYISSSYPIIRIMNSSGNYLIYYIGGGNLMTPFTMNDYLSSATVKDVVIQV